ncbi:hypothetical protein PQQ99_13185 [Paraburkholderia sediminicola]|uniref:hypothetical protein n=1 Tax=Paraburkholderia sediminicola TaxID=458836 RepID=UPI0038B76773
MNLWAFDQLIVKMLRAAGYNERADAVARAASEGVGESRPARYELPNDDGTASAPFQHYGASPHTDATHGAHIPHTASIPDAAEADRPALTQPAVAPGQQAASAAEVDSAEAGDVTGSIGHAGSAHDEASAPEAGHATGRVQNHEHGNAPTGVESGDDHHIHVIDRADPLAGLHSSRLRNSLEREAFGSASSIAQDSAIVERADSFAHRFNERAQSFGPDSLSVDLSRAAQDARIVALNGEIPPFARGDPELDPAIIWALYHSTSREPTLAPTQEPAQSPTASPSRVPDSGMER